MTPDQELRRRNATESKRVARAARAAANVKLEAVAAALRIRTTHVDRLLGEAANHQLSYGDLFLLARAPETAGMLRGLLAPLLEIVDRRSLRLGDLEGMASTSTGRDTALEILRSTVEKLEPIDQLSDTREVAG